MRGLRLTSAEPDHLCLLFDRLILAALVAPIVTFAVGFLLGGLIL